MDRASHRSDDSTWLCSDGTRRNPAIPVVLRRRACTRQSLGVFTLAASPLEVLLSLELTTQLTTIHNAGEFPNSRLNHQERSNKRKIRTQRFD